jgi:hypothetical protein
MTLPNWSRPVAVNCRVPPVWTEALVGATLIEVRTGVAAVTVTLAVLLRPPLAAVTVNGPPGVVAENKPLELIVPPPLTDQVKIGCGLMTLPNWSRPVALNCWLPPVWTEAVAGATLIDVSTGVTGAVTVTLAVLLTMPPLVAVTVNGPPGSWPRTARSS